MEFKKDIQKIIDYSIHFAETMLLDGKEYYPFTATINNKNELVPISYYEEGNEFPDSQIIIDFLSNNLHNELNNKKIKAFGITSDIKVKSFESEETVDAVMIDIHHLNSNEIPKYFFTYSWNSNDELVFGESFGIKR